MVFNNGAPPVPANPNKADSYGMSSAQPVYAPAVGTPAQVNGFFVPKEYFQLARTMFPGAPEQNLQRYLPPVLEALTLYYIADPSMVLMALATIRVETGKFEPINEYISKYNTAPNGQPYGLYDFRKDLGNGAVGDGARYCGRGFVQLTGKYNYQQYSTALGLGNLLIEQPEMANHPVIAARLLACFLKNKNSTIQPALARKDYATARAAVNGGTHGLDQFIASYQAGAHQVGLA